VSKNLVDILTSNNNKLKKIKFSHLLTHPHKIYGNLTSKPYRLRHCPLILIGGVKI